MFRAAPLTIAKTWKQPKCSLMNERIKKMQYIHTIEYYAVKKKKKKTKIMPFATTWTDLEILIRSEIGQKEKGKYHTSLMYMELKYDTNELTYKTETDSQT